MSTGGDDMICLGSAKKEPTPLSKIPAPRSQGTKRKTRGSSVAATSSGVMPTVCDLSAIDSESTIRLVTSHLLDLISDAENRAAAAETSAKSKITQNNKEMVKVKGQYEKAMKLVTENEAKAVEAREAHEKALADAVKIAKTSTMITLLQARLKMVKEARDLGFVNPGWKHEVWIKKLKGLGGDVPAGFEAGETVEGSSKDEAQQEKTQDAGSQRAGAEDVGEGDGGVKVVTEGDNTEADAAAAGTVQ